MRKTENFDGIAPEKYSRRKSTASDIQALKTRIFYDLIRQKRIPATRISEDLVSNYHLLGYSIASLSLQTSDVPKEPILCTFTTIQNMTHSVRTSFGESKSTCGGDNWAVNISPPPQSLGKGNGADPYIWDRVSNPLLNCLRDAGHEAALKCCISGYTKRLLEYSFTNDSKIVQV